jgi:hypothetical protein
MCFSWRPTSIDLDCYFKTIKCPHLDENGLAVKANIAGIEKLNIEHPTSNVEWKNIEEADIYS